MTPFIRSLDRWTLATTLLSTAMFFLASDRPALGVVAGALIVLGFVAGTARGDKPARTSDAGVTLLLNALTLGMLGYAVLRVSSDRELLVQAVGDMLAWALVIRVFDPRPGRRRGLLLLMSIFGALAAVLTSNALIVGLLLFVYAPVAAWAIMLHQFAKGHEQAYRRPLAPALAVPREGLRRLRAISIGLTPAVVVAAAVVYIIMPRGVGADMLGEWSGDTDGATTGFTDRVLLQRSGELTTSDEAVMDVIALDDNGVNVGLADRAILLRGAVLERYDPGAHAWVRENERSRMGRASATYPMEVASVRDATPLTTYRVTMRNKDTDYIFAPLRPVRVYFDRDTIVEAGSGDMVLRAPRRDGRVSYTVLAAPEWTPSDTGDYALEPIAISPALVARAREILAAAGLERDPRDDLTDRDVRIAREFESYFRRNGVYDYQMVPSPAGVDPIERFVLERMRGHCEQFASAMAAMLRGLGVSARVVTGFRAHDYNDIAGHYTVRQRDAHAWVEVRTAPGVWQSFDPSPSQDDALGGMRRGGVLDRARKVYDAVEHFWAVYVVGFDERMKRAIFAKAGLDAVSERMNRRAQNAGAPSPAMLGPRLLRAAGIGLVAFGVTAAALFALSWVSRVIGARVRLPRLSIFGAVHRRGWLRRGRGRGAVAVERRLRRALMALERAGLVRPAHRGAAGHAAHLALVDRPLGEAFGSLAAMHNAARFGGRALSPAEVARADALTRDVERLARDHARNYRRGGASG